MRTITSNSLTKIKNQMEQTMLDSGTVDVFTEVVDSYNSVQKTYVAGSEIKCGFAGASGGKFYKGEYIVESENATVRLSLNTNITVQDHFTLTKKMGASVDPIHFGIESIQPGLGELVIKLKSLEV